MASTGLKGYFFAVCVLAIFLLLGKVLRVKIKLLQTLFLPSSIIAGFVALALGPFGADLFPHWMVADWRELPGVLINVVFAALFLGVNLPGPKTIWNVGGPQLCFGVVMGMGQYLFAMLACALVLTPVFGVPPIFACILEIGFSGGHGTAAGMKEVFEQLDFAAGSDLAQMSATVGIVTAVVMGIVLINIAIRRGYCACLNEDKGIPTYKRIGLIPDQKRFSIATATVAAEAIEPLTFHFAIIGVAILLGLGMQSLIRPLHPQLEGFPLFPLAMIGGLIVQSVALRIKVRMNAQFSDDSEGEAHIIQPGHTEKILKPLSSFFDRDTFDRIMGFSLDILVISAIASIRLDLFLANLAPFMILMAVGIIWLTLAVVLIAPRMFPKFWFEKAITEFGMQSGVTAIGLLLLRLVDPRYKTDTATAFGLKQMVYEPFLGGGLITAMAPFFIGSLGVWASIALSALIMGVFIALAWFNGWVNLNPERKFVGEIEG